MSGATASGTDGSKKDVRRLRNNSGYQCTPLPLPPLGTQRIIQGNGTNVGTVISLQCPAKHRLVGKEMTCVMGPNSTQWVGGTYCRPLSGDYGFRVAVLASIISSGIIMFMSVAFITCCLLDCIKKETRKKSERESNVLRCEEQQVNWNQYNRKGQNNNNNNNNNSRQKKMLPLWDTANPALCENMHLCRCQQQYTHSCSPCTYSHPPSLAALPGHIHPQLLLPRNLDSSCPPRYPGPPLSSCQTPSSGLRSGSSWRYGGEHSSSSELMTDESIRKNKNSNRTPKDISIKIISV
ncbi:uncharacterized protein susd3 [Austrofundulus limnaeus]|uniref:Uncharacterized protein susd3 n=1 Tax=Austrofundulus limnaeus TaxID=52670 RepID=A0A2I4CLT5_AUSLI|nr:PREDICTED: uncharacterized protein LOC106529948 [Austrofundulus limnaeus]